MQFTKTSLARLLKNVDRELLVEAIEEAALESLFLNRHMEVLEDLEGFLNMISNLVVLGKPAFGLLGAENELSDEQIEKGVLHGIRQEKGPQDSQRMHALRFGISALRMLAGGPSFLLELPNLITSAGGALAEAPPERFSAIHEKAEAVLRWNREIVLDMDWLESHHDVTHDATLTTRGHTQIIDRLANEIKEITITGPPPTI